MSSLNKALLIGHLGRDPEMRYLPNGDAVASLNIATTETWKDKSGDKQEKTEWHRVTFFGRIAEIAGKYLHKGSQVYIEGRIETRKYIDKDGVERYATQIIGQEMKMLGGPRDDTIGKPYNMGDENAQKVEQQKQPSIADLEDDIPL